MNFLLRLVVQFHPVNISDCSNDVINYFLVYSLAYLGSCGTCMSFSSVYVNLDELKVYTMRKRRTVRLINACPSKPAKLNMVKNSKQTSIIDFTIASLMAIGPSYRNTSRSIVYLMLA